MSTTTTPPAGPPIGTPNSAGAPTTIRDQVLRVGKDTADVIRLAQTADPDLAEMLSGQAAIQSRALYGPVITAAMTWLVAKYGIGWDAATVNALTGAVAVAVGMLFRVLAKAPITGLFKAAPMGDTGPATPKP